MTSGLIHKDRINNTKLTPLSIHSASAAAFASSFCIFMNDSRRLLSLVVAAVMREANFKRFILMWCLNEEEKVRFDEILIFMSIRCAQNLATCKRRGDLSGV